MAKLFCNTQKRKWSFFLNINFRPLFNNVCWKCLPVLRSRNCFPKTYSSTLDGKLKKYVKYWLETERKRFLQCFSAKQKQLRLQWCDLRHDLPANSLVLNHEGPLSLAQTESQMLREEKVCVLKVIMKERVCFFFSQHLRSSRREAKRVKIKNERKSVANCLIVAVE